MLNFPIAYWLPEELNFLLANHHSCRHIVNDKALRFYTKRFAAVSLGVTINQNPNAKVCRGRIQNVWTTFRFQPDSRKSNDEPIFYTKGFSSYILKYLCPHKSL